MADLEEKLHIAFFIFWSGNVCHRLKNTRLAAENHTATFHAYDLLYYKGDLQFVWMLQIAVIKHSLFLELNLVLGSWMIVFQNCDWVGCFVYRLEAGTMHWSFYGATFSRIRDETKHVSWVLEIDNHEAKHAS